jgi:hypothetical protein
MDPVQYVIYLVKYGDKTVQEAYAHACQRFGLRAAEVEQMILDARRNAEALLEDTEGFLL